MNRQDPLPNCEDANRAMLRLYVAVQIRGVWHRNGVGCNEVNGDGRPAKGNPCIRDLLKNRSGVRVAL